MNKKSGLTLIEVALAVLLVSVIGGALLFGIQRASQGQQTSSARQAAAYLFDYIAGQIARGNPRYTPPEEGNTLILGEADVAAAFAGQSGTTFASTQLLSAQVTYVRQRTETIAGQTVTSVDYNVKTCWTPVSQATGESAETCIEKVVSGPVPSRFAGGSSTPSSESVPVGSGKLILNITTPPGVSGQVSVSGPGINATYTESVVLEGLAPGDYIVTPYPVSDSLYTYTPDLTSSTSPIGAGEGTEVNVTYTATSGALSLSIAVPPGAGTPNVLVSSTSPPFSQTVHSSTTLSHLTPGTYTITASDLDTGSYTYSPTVSPETVVITAGNTASSTVSYGATTGALEVEVAAPPEVATATVRITGPNNYESTVGLGTTTLNNLLEGLYLGLPEDVQVDGVTYAGTVSPDTGAYVSPGATASLRVSYAPTDAALRVRVVADSTPANIDPTVKVDLPGGRQEVLNGLGEYTITGIEEGPFTLTAEPASDGTFTWTADPDTISDTLAVGESQTLEVTYSIRTAVLKIFVSGLPAGAGTPVRLVAPDRTYTFGAGSHEIPAATPGTYELYAESVSAGYFSYAPDPASDSFDLARGAVETRTVAYAPDTGALNLAADGLPQGAAPVFTVSGPSGSSSYTGSQIVPRLVPGAYTVTPEPYNDDYASYTPSPSSSDVQIVAGQIANAQFSYTLLPGNLSIEIAAPAGSTPNVTASGPSGPYVANQPGVNGFTDVTPGVYTLSADPLLYGSIRYVPEYPSEVVVRSGETAHATVTYNPTDAAIEVRITAPGDQANPVIQVSGPNNYATTVTEPTVLEQLEPGRYTLTPQDYTSDGDRFAADPISLDLALGDYRYANVVYTQRTAHLRVNVEGLPAGADASVLVEGPSGYSRTLTASTLITGLEPGSYVITPASVQANGYTYTAPGPSPTILLSAGQEFTYNVVYEATTGVVRLQVSAPDGLAYDVTLSGPDNLTHSGVGDSSRVFTDVTPGDYTVSAPAVTFDHIVYTPTASPASFALAAGTTESVQVTYGATTAALAVEITGLPGGVEAGVTVTGPGGYRTTLTQSGILEGLEPGTYVITADSVLNGIERYEATPASQSVTLAAGETGAASVSYALVGATLKLTVEGLPQGVAASVQLTGPDGFDETATGSYTWTSLDPGRYSLTAYPVDVDPFTYEPNPTFDSRVLVSGITESITVVYTATKGQLVINVSGNTAAPYTLEGPNGYQQTFTGSQELLLDPGEYQLTAPDYTDPDDGHVYRSSSPSRTITVTAGQTATVEFSYDRYTAQIDVSAVGVPPGGTATYTLRPANAPATTHTAPYTHIVPPDTYVLEPEPITSGNYEYRADPVTINAQPGADYSVEFAYRRYTAELQVTVNGLPQGTTPTVTVSDGVTSASQTGTSLTFYLPPGTYNVSGNDVTVGNMTYRSTAQSVTLSEGGSASVSIDYYLYTATLYVTVSGAPITPTVTVSSTSFSSSQSGTALTFYIPPGSYTVAGNRLAYNGYYYEASPKLVTLSNGDTRFIQLSYQATRGKARVYNTGSRTGYPAVTLRGPDGYSSSIPAGSNPTWRNYLVPGTYSLSYTSPYNLTTTKRFVARNVVSPATVSAGSYATLSIYWQYQEWVCTTYFIVCWSWGWVDK